MTASRAAFGIRVPAGRVLDGVIAGAAGTFALEVATYVDMLVRGRPGSDVPAQTAGRLGQVVGLDANGEGSAEHRKTGAGALLGYVDGVATGALYGLTAGAVPRRLAPLVLAGAAMVAGDATPALMGLTDPAEWSASAWLSDIVPHFVYGLVAAFVYDRLASA